ncbi:aminotransferase class V-fold PLP-dependent enzyme [Jannaschia sp. R86511]|uniref:aminotransferase class V-fold PLP-dependent enzyme n=1 Tax=Jannaschia sp. R86511 TaxID=3093853 RepID=UPI0036D3CAF4
MSTSSAGPGPHRVELDTAAAAPPSAAALEAWRSAGPDGWADARGLHATAATARRLLDAARAALAGAVGVAPEAVSLPPDHVRALHAAVLGCGPAGGAARAGAPVVVSAVEHSAVHHAAAWAAARDGAPVRQVGVDHLGHVDLAALAEASAGARLVCVQHANVEIGTVQDLPAVHAVCRAAGVPLLVDAGASLGHVPVPADWDVLVGSPRAWGSVAGVGLLALRPGVRWRAHEPGEAGASRRPGEQPGTVDVPAALAAAVSLQQVLAGPLGRADPRHGLIEQVRAAVRAVPDTVVVGDPEARLPHVLTMSALFVPGEELVRGLDAEGFSVASGSACTADTLRPSHVLAAVGALTHGNVRLGLPRGVPAAEVDRFCAVLPGVVAWLRRELGADGL